LSKTNGRDIFLIVLAVIQISLAAVIFVALVATVLVGAAYLGASPMAPSILLFDLWGLASGLMLIFRRSIGACRLAATWYLPNGIFFVFLANQNSQAHHPDWILLDWFLAFIFLFIFVVLIVPLLPGYFPRSAPLAGK
jgi:hypothetical protein